MRIPAKFPGKCAKCSGPIPKGAEIEYANKQAFHPACYEQPEPDQPPGPEQFATADRLGFIASGGIDEPGFVSVCERWSRLLVLPVPAGDRQAQPVRSDDAPRSLFDSVPPM